MAAIDHSAYMRDAVSPFAAVTDTLVNAKRRVRTYISYRQTLKSLTSLSRRQLDDIGLDGANLEVLARDMAARNTF